MRVSRRTFWVFVAVLVALYVGQGLYYARVIVPVSDGIQFLMVGSHVVRGELGLFDDRLVGNRMPLPFYVLGLTQLGGPTLVVPRLLNVAFGVATLLLVIGLARRLGGDRAGLLAGLFLATQGVVIAYYSYESYPSLAALWLTAAVFLLFSGDSPGHRLAGTVVASLLFFVRTNLWPAVPFLAAYAVWRASGLRERLVLAATVVVPPAIFFASDPTHLKILSYVPVVRRLVTRFGYDASVVFEVQEPLGVKEQIWGLAQIARRYEFFVLGAVLLALIALWRWRARRPLQLARPEIPVLAVFLVYMFVTNLVMFHLKFKWVGLYVVSFIPVLPVLLGVGYGAVLDDTRPGSRGRTLLVGALACLLIPPMYYVRNPLLPIGKVRAQDPFGATHAAAAELRRVVPRDAKVFYYGPNTAYYLAGLPQTYLQQMYNPDAAARPDADEQMVRRYGFIPRADLERWLGTDADFAVIDTLFFDARNSEASHERGAEPLIQELLARRFDLIASVDKPPFQRYAVYKRRSKADTATEPGTPSSARASDTTRTGQLR